MSEIYCESRRGYKVSVLEDEVDSEQYLIRVQDSRGQVDYSISSIEFFVGRDGDLNLVLEEAISKYSLRAEVESQLG